MFQHFLHLLILMIYNSSFIQASLDKKAFHLGTLLDVINQQSSNNNLSENHCPDKLTDWGYEEHNGPSHWGGLCKCGKRQSPININLHQTKIANLGLINFYNYNIPCDLIVDNNGHSVAIHGFEKCNSTPYIEDGGHNYRYDLHGLHFHWGLTNHVGSEHLINGKRFPLELHLVHVKHGFTKDEAATHPDGLAVVGVLYEIETNELSLKALMPAVELVGLSHGSSTQLENFTLDGLLPKHLTEFYRYEGSLTVPDCTEAVIWTIMKAHQSVTKNQMKIFQKINLISGHPEANFRHEQPHNDRVVLHNKILATKTNQHVMISEEEK